MQMTQVQVSMNQIEECADQAMAALRDNGENTPDELRRVVSEMHRQARQVRDLARQANDDSQVRGSVDQLEATGDLAMHACRSAGGHVPPQLQSAIKRTHDEISRLKDELH
jgi:polyhydroxyalkanoate synthesis regulator phasin